MYIMIIFPVIISNIATQNFSSTITLPCQDDTSLFHNTSSQNTSVTCHCERNFVYSGLLDTNTSTGNTYFNLILDRKNLSSYRRSKMSATDNRTASRYVGGLAVIVLVASLSFVIAADVHCLLTEGYFAPMRYNRRYRRRQQETRL